MRLEEIEDCCGNTGKRETKKKALWRGLATGGWFEACREAVEKDEVEYLQQWLAPSDEAKQTTLRFADPDSGDPDPRAMAIARSGIHCALVACRAGAVTGADPGEVTTKLTELAAAALEATGAAGTGNAEEIGDALGKQWTSTDVSAPALADRALGMAAAMRSGSSSDPQPPLGFLRDLTRFLMRQPPRQADVTLPPLTVLLYDRAVKEGVTAALILERVPGGTGVLYPVPELALALSSDFAKGCDDACEAARRQGFSLGDNDVRWNIRVSDRANNMRRPLLGGPSAGAAFALDICKLAVGG